MRGKTDEERITPACAGISFIRAADDLGVGDHPRVRGDKSTGRQPFVAAQGSPPRARG